MISRGIGGIFEETLQPLQILPICSPHRNGHEWSSKLRARDR